MCHTLLDRPRRGPPWARPGLLAAVVLLLPACDPGPGPDRGGLRILVIDDPVAANPLGAVPVQLQGSAIYGMTNSAGFAVFSDLPAGDVVVAAHSIGYCSATAAVTVVAGTTTDLTVPLCPAPGGTSGGNDRVSITTPSPHPGLLLFDAAAAGTCLHDQLVSGLASYLLPVNALPPGSTGGSGETCPTSVTLFTPSHGLWFSSEPAQLPWTPGPDVLPISLPPLLRVPLAIWVAPGLGSPALTDQIRNIHLKEAASILGGAGAGVTLVADEAAGGDPAVVEIPASSPGAPLFPTSGTGCDAATSIMAEPSIYQADKLNVYYVRAITGRGTASTGYYCYIEGARSILFVAVPSGLPHTLAHELGHALGLLEPNWGHTHDYLAGFLTLPPATGTTIGAPRNFMAYGASGDAGRPIYATLGQTFRMNLSPLSWVNLPGTAGTSLRQRAGATPTGVSCPCPAADATADCPVLSLTGSPPDYLSDGPGWELACAVTPALEVITLCVGEARLLSGSLSTTIAGTTLPARSGDLIWISSNPTAVAVDPDKVDTGIDGSNAGWTTLSVTGGSPGDAQVTLYAGGPSATARYDITVKPCP